MSMVVDIHKKNGIRPDFDVYIGRRIRYHEEFTENSKWANQRLSLSDYEKFAREWLWNDLDELEGKRLGCWCVTTTETVPLRCHGQVLMKLLREKNQITKAKEKEKEMKDSDKDREEKTID